jgi:hypothetical protein
MRCEPNHSHYVGEIFREGNHLRRVTWVCGPFYKVQHYSYGIFAERNKPWPTWTSEQLVRRGIVTR